LKKNCDAVEFLKTRTFDDFEGGNFGGNIVLKNWKNFIKKRERINSRWMNVKIIYLGGNSLFHNE
jgi:hypothetical protein